ncbi:hypothetical protein [Xenorhabdus hominickii]|uniref:Membrane protein n=1 Tax=Xenorhabdus hominickii TaxID=351679 RepID=A0A1V0M4U2_XENHO|nr:hypothetical protein [Xenorhabdus hominickii]ARD69892.1 hypothetical protein [Xenorhabdus hominickii]PHM51442.1 membrane protein [Xenorhabdus hominickii]
MSIEDWRSIINNDGDVNKLCFSEDYIKRRRTEEIERKYFNKPSIISNKMSENEEYYLLLTHGQMIEAVKYCCGNNPNASWKSLFSVGDFLSTFSGNILDGWAFLNLANELSMYFGVKVTQYVNGYGHKMVKLTGRAGIRKFLNATKYKIGNFKLIKMGIGTTALLDGIGVVAKRVIFVSVAYRTLELLFRDKYDIYDFFGNITMDIAKTVVGALVGLAFVAGATIAMEAGAYVLVIAVIGLAIGIATTLALSAFDESNDISKKLIKYMREKELAEADKLDYRKQTFGYPYPRIK